MKQLEPSQLYEQYKAQLIQQCDKLESLTPQKDSEQYEKILKETQSLLKHISIELCSLGPDINSEQSAKVLGPYRKKFKGHKKAWEEYKNKQGLFGEQGYSRGQTDRIAIQNEKLSECKKLLYEVENISEDIGENLHQQTEKMRGTKDKVSKIGTVMSKANGLVDRMLARQQRKANLIKIVLGLILLVIGFIKYCCY